VTNGKIWIPVVSLFLAIGGGYLSSQVSLAQQLGDKVSRGELKEAVKDTRDQIQRELNDIKDNQKKTQDDIRDLNRSLQRWMLKNDDSKGHK
jgi:gas vesicle protein